MSVPEVYTHEARAPVGDVEIALLASIDRRFFERLLIDITSDRARAGSSLDVASIYWVSRLAFFEYCYKADDQVYQKLVPRPPAGDQTDPYGKPNEPWWSPALNHFTRIGYPLAWDPKPLPPSTPSLTPKTKTAKIAVNTNLPPTSPNTLSPTKIIRKFRNALDRKLSITEK